MANKGKLQSMLDNLISQKPEQAQVDFHDFLQGKMQEILGTAPQNVYDDVKNNAHDKE